MKNKKVIEKFYLDLLEKNRMEKCPFLIGWFNEKLVEIDNLPEDHDRSGIVKGGRLPVPKLKYVLALHHVTFRKLHLKKFCEIKGINHGTGRNWRNTDKIFQEIALDLVEQFSHAFLRSYSKRLESEPPESFEKALALVQECRYYPGVIVDQVISRLEHYGTKKMKEDGPPSLLTRSTLIHAHRLLLSTLRLSLETADAGRRKFAHTLAEQEFQDVDEFYKELRAVDKSAEAQAAIDLAEMRAWRSVQYFTMILKEFLG